MNDKKMSVISPQFHKDEIVLNFNKKAGILNYFFANQDSLIINNSRLPSKLEYSTRKRLSSIDFSVDDIVKIIRNLDPNTSRIMRLALQC